MIRRLGMATMILGFMALGLRPAYASVSADPFPLKVEADRLLKQGQIERAIQAYETVIAKNPVFANAYYNLATAYYLQGDLEKAVLNLEILVRLEPQDAEALYNLGCLKLRLGAFDEAWKCFLKAEKCPCTRMITRKIKEALQFLKDLQDENPETKNLLAYLLNGTSTSSSLLAV